MSPRGLVTQGLQTVPVQQGTGGSGRLLSLRAPAKDERAGKRQRRDLNPGYLPAKAHSALQGRTGRVTPVQRRGFGALAPRPTFLQTRSWAPVSGFHQQQSRQLPGPALRCFPPSPSASAPQSPEPRCCPGATTRSTPGVLADLVDCIQVRTKRCFYPLVPSQSQRNLWHLY